MSTAMDIFLNASDSLPFPDFLDIDIKTDSDILLGGHSQNDFSGFNFEPIELTEDSKWFLNNTSSNNSNQSIFDFSSGDDGPAMVNPNVVLPLAVSLTGGAFGNNGRSPSPSCGGVKGVGESHLSFSPAAIKISSILQHDKSSKVSNVKKDLINRLNNNIRHQSVNNKKSQSLPILASKPVMSAPTNTVLARQNQLTVQQSPTVRKTFGSIVNRSAATLLEPSNSIIMTAAQPNHQKQKNNNHHLSFLTATTAAAAAATTNDTFCQKVFPKPAYSYSCLIAMALKNSRNGSLPVSEIYSFMCQHFPYFKTAPNGWKNSVRHNLSLNKCFEKIDKPTVNGAQRKGCLWAMNPAKITKMDEEVQKWSRKDPNAIKKAMVNPEHLEFLERGELKFSCQFDDDVDDDAMTVSTKMAAVPLLSDTSSMTSADSDVDEEVMEGGVEERGQTNDVDVDDVSLEYVQMTDDEDVDDDDGDDANGDGATFNKKPIIISNKRRRTYMV